MATEAAWGWLENKPIGYALKRGVVIKSGSRYYVFESTRFEYVLSNTGGALGAPPCRLRDADATVVAWYQLYPYNVGIDLINYWVWQDENGEVHYAEAGF
ncbi:MAG: hypothetical protein R2706_11560 [Acidimicrobiales bacterium]